jgi:hypothetical protein
MKRYEYKISILKRGIPFWAEATVEAENMLQAIITICEQRKSLKDCFEDKFSLLVEEIK